MVSSLERHAEQLRALGHPVRLQILRFVVKGAAGGTAAGDIQSHVGLPASTLSHHLKRLSQGGMLTNRTEGHHRYYAPDYGTLRKLTNYLWEDCCKRAGSAR